MDWFRALAGEHVALGLSGGADSVALLWRCVAQGLQITALHFNHGFEDENGDEAEAFCRALCARAGVALRVGRCEAQRPARGWSKEAFARRHRMAFFVRELRALGLRTILLAHQADDRAEGLVLRLARGCGGAALTGFGSEAPLPGARDLRLVRPLLHETHANLVAELRARGEAWVEDCSNADVRIPRNALRRCLVPTLPHFTAGVNAAAHLLAEDEAYLESAARAATQSLTPTELHLAPETPRVLARRALRRWLSGTDKGPLGPGQAACERLLALEPGAVTMLPGPLRIRRLSSTAWLREPLR